MPLIVVNTTAKLEKDQKDTLKKRLGEIVSILPKKSEENLMVDISDEHTIYFKGKELEKGAWVDTRVYGAIDFEPKAVFTREVYKLLSEVLGITEQEAYIVIGEYDVWGTNGNLK